MSLNEAGGTAQNRGNPGSTTPVLVVEDSAIEAEMLRRALAHGGYAAAVAKDGAEGLSAVRSGKPALVISDIVMPEMDGYALCRAIKSDPELRGIPVILVTVLSSPEDIIQAIEAGADGYATKPYDEELLFGRLRSLLAGGNGAAPETGAERRHGERRAAEVEYKGKRWRITANRRQILNLLLSVYENALLQNRRLAAMQSEIQLLNEQLEQKVQERTIALQESEERLRIASETANDAIVIIRGSGAIYQWNKKAEQMFGYTAAEAVGRELHALIVPEKYRETAGQGLQSFARSGEGAVLGKTLEMTALRRDGTEFPVELSISAMKIGAEWHATGIIRDISERVQAQAVQQRLHRTLQTLSACNIALVHATEEQALLDQTCGILVETGGYRLVGVGYAESDEAKTIRIRAHAGYDEGYTETLNLTWADTERGRGPGGAAIRGGEAVICRDIAGDGAFAPWREAALKRGYASMIALPLKSGGRAFGVLGIYSGRREAFDQDEVKLLTELAGDLAYGIVMLRTRIEHEKMGHELEQAYARTRKVFDEAIGALIQAVEMRDPYTAGHERRVADLAAAIGREMGLDDNEIAGIHLAASIHDIGKIYIPAEILAKPARLSEIEMSLIRLHAQAGYDILKGVEFPWPVAQMVLQHHERLDGSGYPSGLKDGEILPGARIIGVADTVEAMTSHRPYRPGFGPDKALREIMQHRGVLYDADAADACVGLFARKGYVFE